MKRFVFTRVCRAAILLMLVTGISKISLAQTQYQSAAMKITVEGTSNIHDWDMNASKGTATAEFVFDANGTLTELSSLSFSMAAESLKSEHTTMDNNAYKAMSASKYPTISFTATSSTVRHTGGNNYVIETRGKLSISSVTRDVDLVTNCTVNPADKSINSTGSYKLKMTQYNVKPPSIMFGAIKTGDAVTIKFNFLLRTH